MKIIPLIGLLLFTISCKVEKKSESCKYNGQKVDCKEMPQKGQTVTVESGKVVTKIARISFNIETQDTPDGLKLSAIENASSRNEEKEECEVHVYNGETFNLSKKNGKLQVVSSEGRNTLMSADGSITNKYFGLWSAQGVDSEGNNIRHWLELHSRTRMSLTVECSYY